MTMSLIGSLSRSLEVGLATKQTPQRKGAFMRKSKAIPLVVLTVLGGLLAQTQQQQLFDEFQHNSGDPTKAYSIAKRYLDAFHDDGMQTATVRRWMDAYERVAERAS